MPRTYVPKRLQPPDDLVAEWRDVARVADLDSDRYIKRWTTFWLATLKACQDQGTWDDLYLETLRDYVEAKRLQQRHKAEAQAAPYRRTDSGRTFAHPGFALARDAEREAREYARELKLTPTARAEAGLDEPGDGDGPQGDQAGL